MSIRSRKVDLSEYQDDDVISFSGSISGHSFASRKNRNSCTLRKHQIDLIAHKLKGLNTDNNIQDDSNQKKQQQDFKRKKFNTCFHYYRFVVVLMGGWAVGSMCLLRYSMSVSLVNMVNQTALYMEEHPNKTIEDFFEEGYTLGGEFDWNNEIQQMLLSWYMIAYTIPQLPSTKLGLMIGSRLAIPIMLLICSISTLLTPLAAYSSWKWVLALRLVQGIGASGILPIQLNLIENWMPYDELGLGLTCVIIVPAIFLAAHPILMGYLCNIHWSYSFYVPSIFTIIFALIWIALVTDRPDESWLVSDDELSIICGCCRSQDNKQNSVVQQCKIHKNHNVNNITQKEEKKSIISISNKLEGELVDSKEFVKYQATWIDPLKIPSFYAFLVLWSIHASSFVDFIFILPNYLRQFLKVQVSLNGAYCSVIHSGCILAVIWPHPFLRTLETKFNLSLTAARRITNTLVSLVVAGTWIYVGIFHQCQLLMFFINRCFHSTNEILVTGSIMSNYAKLGISSIAFSIMNTIGNLFCVASSTFIGYVLDRTGQSVEAWSWIYIGLGISQFIVFFLFSTMITSNPIEIKRKDNKAELA